MKRVVASLLFVLTTPLAAQANCDPREFLSARDFSSRTWSSQELMALFSEEQRINDEARSSSLNVLLPIGNTPVKLDYNDAQSLYHEYIKKNKQIFTKKESEFILQSKLSPSAEVMYARCLESQSPLSIKVVSGNYTQDRFTVQIRWSPNYNGARTTLELEAYGGKINGKEIIKIRTVAPYENSFYITRDSGNDIALTLRGDRKSQSIEIPAQRQVSDPKLQIRTTREGPWHRGKDHGKDILERTSCIESAGGKFLPSSAGIVDQYISRASGSEDLGARINEKTANRVCLFLWNRHGDSNGISTITTGFSVIEIID